MAENGTFYSIYRFFIFHPILIGFFSLDSSLPELSVECQRFSCSLYCFQNIRGQKGPWPKILTFSFKVRFQQTFFFNIFVLMSTKRICQQIWAIGSHFEMKRGQRGRKRYFYSICRFFISFILLCPTKSLCQANYCIKHRICIHTHFNSSFAPIFRVRHCGALPTTPVSTCSSF